MELIAAVLGLSLVVSLAFNVAAYVLAAKARKAFRVTVAGLEQKLAQAEKAPTRQLTVTAEELLHDLTAGAAVVRIERVNPADLWLRSPRQ